MNTAFPYHQSSFHYSRHWPSLPSTSLQSSWPLLFKGLACCAPSHLPSLSHRSHRQVEVTILPEHPVFLSETSQPWRSPSPPIYSWLSIAQLSDSTSGLLVGISRKELFPAASEPLLKTGPVSSSLLFKKKKKPPSICLGIEQVPNMYLYLMGLHYEIRDANSPKYGAYLGRLL